MAAYTRSPKPVLDAINDTVAALSDLVRSLRASAATSRRDARRPKAKLPATTRRPRTRALVVKATVRRQTQALDAQVRGRRHGIKARIVHAWDLLTRDPAGNGAAHATARRRLP